MIFVSGLEDDLEEKVWKIPETGWGEFQELFDSLYDYTEEILLERIPFVENEDRIEFSTNCAEFMLLEIIELMGFRVI